MGDEAVRATTGSFYSSELDNDENKRFVADMRKDYDLDPGYMRQWCILRRLLIMLFASLMEMSRTAPGLWR